MRKKVNIYCPTYHRFEKTRNSISSIIDSVHMSKNDVMLYIIDNNSPQEMKDWLESQSSENVVVELLKENIGKGDAINNSFNKTRESDYIISIDSDIVNKHNINWIDMFVDIMENDNEWGVIACDFKDGDGLNIHIKNHLTKKKSVANYTVKFGDRGIAGCAIIMRSNEFRNIDCYNNKDIFTGHDGMLMKQVVEILKKKCGVCAEAILYHPHADTGVEKKYQAWKHKKHRKKLEWNKAPNTGFYERNE